MQGSPVCDAPGPTAHSQVADCWLSMWQQIVQHHRSTGKGPVACDTGEGAAPHPAILASAAQHSLAWPPAAAEAAWRAAQAQAGVLAGELGDGVLLQARSLHRCAAPCAAS